MEYVWNPWHGCKKVSPGCLNCYVYRIDKSHGKEEDSIKCQKTLNYNLPIKKNKNGDYKIPKNSVIFTCFTSDFFIDEADEWRREAWKYIKERSDCKFLFFTKRIDRFEGCIPSDWGEGYDNVIIGCTVENQNMADYRLPIFVSLPIKHRIIGAEPLLEKIELSDYLAGKIEEVSVGGESGENVRICNYDWVLDIRRQCISAGVKFSFHQTGSEFIKDGKKYNIPRRLQHSQAKAANIDT